MSVWMLLLKQMRDESLKRSINTAHVLGTVATTNDCPWTTKTLGFKNSGSVLLCYLI